MGSRAFHLDPGAPLAGEIRRVARGRIEHALEGLSEGPPEESVHEARKDMKKLRSLLRLAQGALPAELRRAENSCFRDAAMELAVARDSDVLTETLDALELRDTVAGPLRQAVEAQRLRTAGRADATRAAVATLEAARERVAGWPLDADSFDALRPGLERSYRRGRREMRAARSGPTAEALHAWRKRVKDLWYHHVLLRALWPPVVGALADEAHELSERLGLDHDHALLTTWAREHADAPDELVAAVDERRAALQTEAFALAARVYAEKPGAYARRVEELWKAAARP